MSATRRGLLVTAAAVLATRGRALGQPARKTPRVDLLRTQSRDTPDPAVDGFRQGLRELGYVEGETIILEQRWADGRPERLQALAVELAALGVDVIVAGGEQAILAARRATGAIPVVMGASNDPVGAGLVASLARPGGNVTGVTIISPELSRKRLELLKEVVPRASRIAVLLNPGFPGTAADLRELRSAARSLDLALQEIEVRSPAGLDAAFAAARADAVAPLADPFFTAQRARIVGLAARRRLPGVYDWKEFVEAGGLISCGPSLPDLYRRAARHVDRILKGARPGDLPVEQPTTFEVAVNLDTARALGVTVPRSVLVRADKVIP